MLVRSVGSVGDSHPGNQKRGGQKRRRTQTYWGARTTYAREKRNRPLSLLLNPPPSFSFREEGLKRSGRLIRKRDTKKTFKKTEFLKNKGGLLQRRKMGVIKVRLQ